MPRLKIGDKVYSTDALQDISLANLLIFKTQAHPFTWADVQRLGDELDLMDEDAAEAAFERDPEYMLPLAVMVWLARKEAGEEADFWEAINISASSVSFLPEPGDKKPGKPKGPKKAQKSPRGSGQANASRPSEPSPSTSTDSSETSEAE